MTTIGEVNRMERANFVEQFGGVFEHASWVAEQAWTLRPFTSIDALFGAMQRIVSQASEEKKLALLRAHPELAGREAAEGALTSHSSGEQARLGFLALSKAEVARMAELNARYRGKFGFPCIVALALHRSRESVMAEMARRLDGEPAAELAIALAQVGHIARSRLEKLIDHGETQHARP